MISASDPFVFLSDLRLLILVVRESCDGFRLYPNRFSQRTLAPSPPPPLDINAKNTAGCVDCVHRVTKWL